MTKKFTIAVILCILVMIVSEYVLLTELFSQKRLPIVALSAIALLLSIIFFLRIYKNYKKSM
jgi:membrane-bound ClpP family serine protease